MVKSVRVIPITRTLEMAYSWGESYFRGNAGRYFSDMKNDTPLVVK